VIQKVQASGNTFAKPIAPQKKLNTLTVTLNTNVGAIVPRSFLGKLTVPTSTTGGTSAPFQVEVGTSGP